MTQLLCVRRSVVSCEPWSAGINIFGGRGWTSQSLQGDRCFWASRSCMVELLLCFLPHLLILLIGLTFLLLFLTHSTGLDIHLCKYANLILLSLFPVLCHLIIPSSICSALKHLTLQSSITHSHFLPSHFFDHIHSPLAPSFIFCLDPFTTLPLLPSRLLLVWVRLELQPLPNHATNPTSTPSRSSSTLLTDKGVGCLERSVHCLWFMLPNWQCQSLALIHLPLPGLLK